MKNDICNLKELRESKNMTQIELSKRMNIPLSNIAMYETGKRVPSLKRALLIASFFNVALEDIFLTKKLTKEYEKTQKLTK